MPPGAPRKPHSEPFVHPVRSNKVFFSGHGSGEAFGGSPGRLSITFSNNVNVLLEVFSIETVRSYIFCSTFRSPLSLQVPESALQSIGGSYREVSSRRSGRGSVRGSRFGCSFFTLVRCFSYILLV